MMAQRRIAIVDDDPGVRQSVDRLMRSAGFAVTTFTSGEDFLRRAQSMPVDCLVLDLHLGGITGIELEEALNSRGVGLPVVFITAHDKGSVRVRLEQAHAGAVLPKLFDDEALLEAIRLVLLPAP